MRPTDIDRNISILVVDDQALTRNMVKSILKGLGYSVVHVAENGNIAIDMLQKERIDLVICDWNMPLVSGLDVLRRLRTTPETRNIPFIMLTAEAYRENVEAAVEAGVSDYIVKPFTPDTLAEKVEMVVRRGRVE